MSVTEMKRNTKLLSEVEAATDFRVTYKNPDGEWVRLRADGILLKKLSRCILIERLDKLLPPVLERAVNKVLRCFLV